MATQSKLLDTEFLKKLERLSEVSKRPFPGRLKAEKRPLRRGMGGDRLSIVGFGGGEDLSGTDGNVPSQLEQLFTKLFAVPEDVAIHLLLDASQSMEYRLPADGAIATKFDFARKLAAAMGYVGLIRYDRVGVACFAQTFGRRVPTLRGRSAASDMFSYLESLRPGGRRNFSRALQNFAARTPTPGVCVVLSDFFDPGWEKGVRALLARRHHVVLLQILAADEIDPSGSGDLRLVDAETGAARDVTLAPAVLACYREAFFVFCRSLAERSARFGMDYVRTTTDAPFEDLLLSTLRGLGPLGG
jgi:uncharacterized protein (DUF58 family)